MFYNFRQNNSGGTFQFDGIVGLSVNVIVEAPSAKDANMIAEHRLGIYFDGCDSGMDCDCCGDRWYEVDEHDAKEVPSIWEEDVSDGVMKPPMFTTWSRDGIEGYIHYLDGTIKPVRVRAEEGEDEA